MRLCFSVEEFIFLSLVFYLFSGVSSLAADILFVGRVCSLGRPSSHFRAKYLPEGGRTNVVVDVSMCQVEDFHIGSTSLLLGTSYIDAGTSCHFFWSISRLLFVVGRLW